MRVLVVSDAFWPDHTGGITKSLRAEVEGLVARGHRVTVVTRSLLKELPPHEIRGGYEVYRYRSPLVNSRFYRMYPLFSIFQLPRLLNNLKHQKFDVCCVHNPFQMLGVVRVASNIPIVYVYHAPIAMEVSIDAKRGKYGIFGKFLPVANLALSWVEYRALTRARVIVVRSDFMAKELRRLYGDSIFNKTITIPLGVDPNRFSFRDDPRVARRALGLPQDRPLLLTVRRLVARMGLENLIDAMDLVIKNHPGSLLLIGGVGYLRDALEKRIRARNLSHCVQMIGFIPEDKLPNYYQAADLFIMPTAELEGFGLSTIEALSCGTPVIATPVGANVEVVGPLGEEFLSKDITPHALAERINWWLSRGVSPEIRQRCRTYCVSRFAIDSVVMTLEQILDQARDPNTFLA